MDLLAKLVEQRLAKKLKKRVSLEPAHPKKEGGRALSSFLRHFVEAKKE